MWYQCCKCCHGSRYITKYQLSFTFFLFLFFFFLYKWSHMEFHLNSNKCYSFCDAFPTKASACCLPPPQPLSDGAVEQCMFYACFYSPRAHLPWQLSFNCSTAFRLQSSSRECLNQSVNQAFNGVFRAQFELNKIFNN